MTSLATHNSAQHTTGLAYVTKRTATIKMHYTGLCGPNLVTKWDWINRSSTRICSYTQKLTRTIICRTQKMLICTVCPQPRSRNDAIWESQNINSNPTRKRFVSCISPGMLSQDKRYITLILIFFHRNVLCKEKRNVCMSLKWIKNKRSQFLLQWITYFNFINIFVKVFWTQKTLGGLGIPFGATLLVSQMPFFLSLAE